MFSYYQLLLLFQVKNVMLQSTHVLHLHAQTEPNVNNFSKADFSADAKLDGKDLFVIKTLMIALISHVPLVPIVLIL